MSVQQKSGDTFVMYITKDAILEKSRGDLCHTGCVAGALNYDFCGLRVYSHLLYDAGVNL
jgi:hypothetical protein